MLDTITITGAKVHNLKDVSLTLPKHKLIVFTGVSGSGKSSLAFDTIFAEGQRRYMESLSAYARQFMNQMDKPDVENIEGLSPAISIDQKAASQNPRSTVGTVTEIYDYLRLLFASIGKPHCPNCGRPIRSQSIQEIRDTIFKWPEGTNVMLLAPMAKNKKGEFKDLFEKVQKDGFTRVRVDGEIVRITDVKALDKNKKHNIDIVVDRLAIGDDNKSRLFESIETCTKYSQGLVQVEKVDNGETHLFSEHLSCPNCHIAIAEISPRLFSFNSPIGACAECNGLGDKFDFDEHLIADMTEKQRKSLMGTAANLPPAEAIERLRRGYENTYSEGLRFFFRSFMSPKTCEACQGARLKPAALSVTLHKHSIAQVTAKSVRDLLAFFAELELTAKEKEISRQIVKEINARLNFLKNVGLDYLTLNRKAGTLSGGEFQRIRLATQIGAGLTGVLYVLDEPSIGLHQRDNLKLIEALVRLKDLGNTLIVVEHDEDTIRHADFIVDIGPGAGKNGGQVVFSGTLPQLLKSECLTADYLNKKKVIRVAKKRESSSGARPLQAPPPAPFAATPRGRSVAHDGAGAIAPVLKVWGARENNLKGIDVEFPLGKLVCVTGVSGSGKSTLVNDILNVALTRHYYKSKDIPGKHDKITGAEFLDKLITIDQSPIGRTPRSNPATYTGLFAPIRDIFAATKEARVRGYGPGRFSFNVKGGRCEACEGDGVVKIEMHFLADVYVSCEVCRGKRYNQETLEVTYKGYTISDVLDMTIAEAAQLFENIPTIKSKCQTLIDVGLSYIHLGQNATTLSGGEAQRIKLSKELSRASTGRTLYLLDEPTTGLHFSDIQKLLDVLNRLVDAGNTVIVIEHNLDVIRTADWIVDLGPEGGDAGGQIIATGTPAQVAKVKKSYTGQFLSKIL